MPDQSGGDTPLIVRVSFGNHRFAVFKPHAFGQRQPGDVGAQIIADGRCVRERSGCCGIRDIARRAGLLRLLRHRVFGRLQIVAGGPVIVGVGAVTFGDHIECFAVQHDRIRERSSRELHLRGPRQRRRVMRAMRQIAVAIDTERVLGMFMGLVKQPG